jgi:hypothetical protein
MKSLVVTKALPEVTVMKKQLIVILIERRWKCPSIL